LQGVNAVREGGIVFKRWDGIQEGRTGVRESQTDVCEGQTGVLEEGWTGERCW
jgi:hypothetical protein